MKSCVMNSVPSTNQSRDRARRFNNLSDFMKARFGERVQKLSVDAGFTCPNRDGTRGRDGCTFCNNNAFSPPYCTKGGGVAEQLAAGVEFHKKRYRRVSKYMAYFQAYTSTYGDVRELIPLYGEALSFPGVVGLVIGTRPDCMPDELLDYLEALSEKTYVLVEYGIESCYNHTLRRINRGHSFEDSVDALERTAARGIRTGGHFIIGLPGEDRSEILEEMKLVSNLPLDHIKFHQLQVVRNTRMAREYRKDPAQFTDYGLEEYLGLMAEVVEVLNPDFVIERIAGEVRPGYQVSAGWDLRYDQVVRKFEDLLEERDSWQGKQFRKKRN